MKNTYLEGGKICTAHGVKGLVKVEHLCDSASVLTGSKRVFTRERDGSYTERKVISASVMGAFVLVNIEGINSREEAIACRGRMLYLHRDDVPLSDGAMFIADMIGLPVFHAESGEPLGEICDVSDIAGRRIYTVKYEGREVMIPDVSEFIKEISEEGGMKVLPIPGLFDDEI
ncbi:MAG: 16S rRNA processing protein RimM [Clostridia bacterium]|nr:16S rRNA processing protein RimM [Clostridia bacterium]